MQMLLSQTTKTREKGKEMIEEEKASPSTQLQSGVIMYEAEKILNFLNTGVMILPGTGRSDWKLSTDEQFEYMLRMHKRLSALYDLYRRLLRVTIRGFCSSTTRDRQRLNAIQNLL
jgi:hypothetical protein